MHLHAFFCILAAIPAMVAGIAVAAPAVSRDVDKVETYGNFSATCQNAVIVDNSILRAKCTCTGVGLCLDGYEWTDLDLNQCVGYDGGDLVWQQIGKFTNYCHTIWISGQPDFGPKGTFPTSPFLRADQCRYTDTYPAPSALDLDTGISNVKGILACRGGMGILSPFA